MKAGYIGDSFYNGRCLTGGKIYEIIGEEDGMYRVIDDSGEDYLYSKIGPQCPMVSVRKSDEPGRWEMIEE